MSMHLVRRALGVRGVQPRAAHKHRHTIIAMFSLSAYSLIQQTSIRQILRVQDIEQAVLLGLKSLKQTSQ